MKGQKIVILGINPSHNTSAAILVDGKIVAACQEERFSRKKNHIGLPLKSIDYCLQTAGVSINEIDWLTVAGRTHFFYLSIIRDADLKQSNNLLKLDAVFRWFRYGFVHELAYRIPPLGLIDFLMEEILERTVKRLGRKKYKKLLVELLKVDPKKIVFIKHHEAHSAWSYFSSGFAGSKDSTLTFCLDGGGDGVVSSLWLGKGSKMKLIASTPWHKSLGYLYLYTTYYLGLKPIEDEYKVMGLAPYANSQKVEELTVKLRPFIKIDKRRLVFDSPINTNVFHKYLPSIYQRQRFDVISGAIQKLTEETIYEWVDIAVKRYKVGQITTGGGVFANVKCNKVILEIKNIKKVFFAPSPGDETNAMGACFWQYSQVYSKLPEPLNDIYLGPQAFEIDIKNAIKQARQSGFKVTKLKKPSEVIARLLAEGNVIARVVGRMEFGARALGNRSILADPSHLEIKDEINKSIKSRDFWMPFAPVILSEHTSEYLKNSKGVESAYMMVAFETTPKGALDLAAAVHPYDKTARAQILTRDVNNDYYDMVKEFGRLTGRWGLLNTSFNLHGEPIVLTPEDALHTLENSDLKYLQIENYLIAKKEVSG